jgi:hypothetical protein
MIIVIDNNNILEEFIDVTIPLNKTNYGVVFDPSDYTKSLITLSGVEIVEDIATVHFLLYMQENISHAINNHNRRDLVEKFIATDAYSSFMYSTTIIQERFIEGEPIMKTDKQIWDAYETLMSNGKLNIDGLIADAVARGKTVRTKVI